MNGQLTIVSCGLGPADLTQRHLAAVANAEILAGGRRLLGWFPEFTGTKVTIGANAVETAAELARLAENQAVTVLASGDALFFGVARLFLPLLQADNLTILPNISAAQAALARLHMPWHHTRFFTVHGRTATLPWRSILWAPSAVIYADHKRTPALIAAELLTHFPAAAARPAAVAENLGADEKIMEAPLADLVNNSSSGLAMLILKEQSEVNTTAMPTLQLGRADDCYQHERGLITHAEIRAIVLSKLSLRPGVLWDLGAGSGSVALEAAALCEQLRIFAVEAKPERCAQIQQNVSASGCSSRIEIIQADALQAIPELPTPNSVFVGGGGLQVRQIVENAFSRLHPQGCLVAAAILEETRTALCNVLPGVERDVIEVAINRRVPLGRGNMMKPDNPISLFRLQK